MMLEWYLQSSLGSGMVLNGVLNPFPLPSAGTCSAITTRRSRNTMPTPLEAWYFEIPIITRTYITAAVIVRALYVSIEPRLSCWRARFPILIFLQRSPSNWEC